MHSQQSVRGHFSKQKLEYVICISILLAFVSRVEGVAVEISFQNGEDGFYGTKLDLKDDSSFYEHHHSDVSGAAAGGGYIGKYVESDTLIILKYQTHDENIDTRTVVFRKIKWAHRIYLLQEQGIIWFCNEINSGHEPRSRIVPDGYGGCYMDIQGADTSPIGNPELSPAELGYILKSPVVGKFIYIFDTYTAIIDLGTSDGLMPGISLYMISLSEGRDSIFHTYNKPLDILEAHANTSVVASMIRPTKIPRGFNVQAVTEMANWYPIDTGSFVTSREYLDEVHDSVATAERVWGSRLARYKSIK